MVIRHQYSSSGKRIASQMPNGDVAQYEFDDNGDFERMFFGGQFVAQVKRDEMGREIQRHTANNLITEQNYDPQGRLKRQYTYQQNGTAITERQYGYNKNQQLSRIDDSLRGRTEYFYDVLDRLTQVGGPQPQQFAHDPAGNILSINGQNTQHKGNRLLMQGDAHFEYDSMGNRTKQKRGTGQSLSYPHEFYPHSTDSI